MTDETEVVSVETNRRSWAARIVRTAAFRVGAYTELMDDRRAFWQSALTTALAWLVFYLLLFEDNLFLFGVNVLYVSDWSEVLLGSVFGTVALIVWTGVVMLFMGPKLWKRVTYSQLLSGIGFASIGWLGYQVAGLGLNRAGVASPAILILILWPMGMQVHGVREMSGSSMTRAVVSVFLPFVLLSFGLLFAVLWIAAMFGI